MTTKRLDLYTPFHKGIRKLLFELAVAVGQADFRRREAALVACDAVRRAFGMLHEHAQIEDAHFHPAIEERDPGATADLEDQHHHEEELMHGIEEQVARVSSEQDGAARERLGLHLYRSINAFCASYLNHLAAEEEHLMPRFWGHFSDAELAGIRGRAQAAVSPERMHEWFQVVIPAFNLEERASMLNGIKANAPEKSFAQACAAARDSLPLPEWEELAEQLGVEPWPGDHRGR